MNMLELFGAICAAHSYHIERTKRVLIEYRLTGHDTGVRVSVDYDRRSQHYGSISGFEHSSWYRTPLHHSADIRDALLDVAKKMRLQALPTSCAIRWCRLEMG